MFLELEEKIKKLETQVKEIQEKLGMNESAEKIIAQPMKKEMASKDTSHKNLQTR